MAAGRRSGGAGGWLPCAGVGSSLPEHGQPAEEVLARLEELRGGDVRWRDGRALTLAYTAGPEVQAVAEEAYRRYMTENALNTDAFPSLRAHAAGRRRHRGRLAARRA